MNKTALAIEKIAKIDIHDSTGQVKDFYTIMDEISKKWDSLSKKDKSALSEAIAGI